MFCTIMQDVIIGWLFLKYLHTFNINNDHTLLGMQFIFNETINFRQIAMINLKYYIITCLLIKMRCEKNQKLLKR